MIIIDNQITKQIPLDAGLGATAYSCFGLVGFHQCSVLWHCSLVLYTCICAVSSEFGQLHYPRLACIVTQIVAPSRDFNDSSSVIQFRVFIGEVMNERTCTHKTMLETELLGDILQPGYI